MKFVVFDVVYIPNAKLRKKKTIQTLLRLRRKGFVKCDASHFTHRATIRPFKK